MALFCALGKVFQVPFSSSIWSHDQLGCCVSTLIQVCYFIPTDLIGFVANLGVCFWSLHSDLKICGEIFDLPIFEGSSDTVNHSGWEGKKDHNNKDSILATPTPISLSLDKLVRQKCDHRYPCVQTWQILKLKKSKQVVLSRLIWLKALM